MKKSGNKNRWVSLAMIIIGISGLAALILLGFSFEHISYQIKLDLLLFSLLYLMTSTWAVGLPSGAKFRPAMTFVLAGLLIFPFKVVILIPLLGIVFFAIKNKRSWADVFITIGHLSFGIYVGGLVLAVLSPRLPASLPYLYIPMGLALLLHFAVNRFVAALIVTYRKRNSLKYQLALVRQDLNWVYFSIYLLSIQMALVFITFQLWGLLSAIFMLVTIFKAVSYYQRYRVVAKRAVTDALTGAENRMAWEILVQEMGTKPEPGSLMMIDLDNFKKLNDEYGHRYGDSKLIELVSRLKEMLPIEYRLFRYGGDEFILYLYHEVEDYLAVTEMVEEVIDRLNQTWSSEQLTISISSGIAGVQPGKRLDNLLNKVDEIMYGEKYMKKQQP